MSRYRFVEAEKANHSVWLLCRVVGVSRSGYYAWVGRPPSLRSRCDEVLSDRIKEIHQRSRGTYGAPRIHAELKAEDGIRCGRKRVARLMRQADLQGCHRRKAARTTRRDPIATEVATDLVRRTFAAPAPDRLWVADVTYIPTWEGFLYLAFVLDVFSRRVVGWSMANHLRTRLVIDALEMAILRRRPAPGLVHHSDRGSQYTSVEFGSRLEEAGLLPSMGSVADPYDNAMAESFVATLKCELLHDSSSLPTHEAARTAIFEYVEGFYNSRRLHSSLGYLSPADYERGKLGEAMVA